MPSGRKEVAQIIPVEHASVIQLPFYLAILLLPKQGHLR